MSLRFGRYELVGRLGRGGMAELFLARSRGPEGFEKRLVIKRVLPSLSGDRRFLRLFFEEARIQVSLSHGNLVHVFDFGRVANAYFIAMEHVPGCDLGTLLHVARTRGEPFGPRLVAFIGREVCRGLAYVHRHGFVHRDVGPRNVLLSTDGQVKLADFGVAVGAESTGAPGIRGTVAYMAPERARSKRPDGRADLFALGVVLAEALLLRKLRVTVEGEDRLEAARHPAPITVAVDSPLGRVIERATAPAPSDRFPDAEAMLVALEEVARELGGSDAAAGRDLAARVAGSVASIEELPGESAASGEPPEEPDATARGEDTYFRDSETRESFVDDVLKEPSASPSAPGPPSQPASRRSSMLVLGAGLAALGLSVAVLRLPQESPLSGRPADLGAQPAPRAPVATAAQIAPLNPSLDGGSAGTLAPPTVAAEATHPSPGRRTPSTATGTLTIFCTPWCVPLVDDAVRGQDGRRHELTLRAGNHRIIARRLADRQTSTVEVRPGESRRIDFKFR